MTADYDLSQLESSQADLWIFLRKDAICAEILARQIDRANIRNKRPHCEGRAEVMPASAPSMLVIPTDPGRRQN